MEKTKEKLKNESKPDDMAGHHTPEKELACVVLHAGEMEDIRYLKDYLDMTKLTGELNVNEIDSKGCTPLHFSVASRKVEVVKTLVEYGANVNQRDFMGFTALFWATGRYPSVDIASYLIEKGRASVHITTETGACALHGAALQGNIDCVKLLLKHGADARCADHNGHTPLDLAKDDVTKKLLEKALRHTDKAPEKFDGSCQQCGVKMANLKRCRRCFVTKYCSQACQLKHWKEGGHRKQCVGHVVGRPQSQYVRQQCVLNLNTNSLKTYSYKPGDNDKPVLTKKKFIVKVQLPLNSMGPEMADINGVMMVYNEDRSVTGGILVKEPGYAALKDLIDKEGYRGIKAFFWAELDLEAGDGTFKVFHGKCAPYQTW